MKRNESALSQEVLEAVARHHGVEVELLTPPIYEAIDPESLDHLFRNTSGIVGFQYRNVWVTVTDDGTVETVSLDSI